MYDDHNLGKLVRSLNICSYGLRDNQTNFLTTYIATNHVNVVLPLFYGDEIQEYANISH